MGARLKGWAQTRCSATSGNHVLNASTDTALNPVTSVGGGTDRADSKVFLVAGIAQSIRWGGIDDLSLAWGAGLTTNTQVVRCDVMYETTQTSIANDVFTLAGSGGLSTGLDRTFSFTPAVTGTYRLKVNVVVTVTASSSAVANDNTDNGNFGSAAPARLGGVTNLSFNPGLLAIGCPLSSWSSSPAAPYFFTGPVTSITQSFVFSVGTQASPDASESLALSWRDGSDTQFASDTVAATASATKTSPGRNMQPSTGFPAANTAVGDHLSFNNSALSTALSGSGIPWSFITTMPAGWSAVVSNSVGATEVKVASLFNADPRLKCHAHAQKSTTWTNSPPDPGSPSPWDSGGDDFYLYVISSDLFSGWLSVFNMNNVGINGITGTMHLADPNTPTPTTGGPGDHTQTLATTTVASNPLGWSRQSTPFSFTPAPPGGQWHYWCETATDGTSTWSRLNGYLIEAEFHADAVGAFQGFATSLGFVSAFRGNLAVLLGIEFIETGSGRKRLPYPGDQIRIWIRVLKDAIGAGNFTGYQVDIGTIPNLKVIRLDQSDNHVVFVVGTDSGAPGNMTLSTSDPSLWYYDLNSTGFLEDVYVVQTSAQLDGAVIEESGMFFLFHQLSTISGLIGLPSPAV